MTNKIVGVVLAHNEEAHIVDCIDSLRWVDEVVVFESNKSTDRTIELAEQAGARVIRHDFVDFAQQRNAALERVDAEWVLFVDADERIPQALSSEIRRVLKEPKHHGYWIPRHNYIFGRLTRHTGWYPDYQMRLLRRDMVRYDPDRQVHEVVQIQDGTKAGYLLNPFVHYNYKNLDHFLEKQRRYARYDAKIMHEHGVRAKPHNFILQPLRQFRWRFFTLDGYKDGWHGLKLSVLMAWNEFDKYRNLRRLNKGQSL
jgi:glycosyltransferase involved in cell wall biosynthesis